MTGEMTKPQIVAIQEVEAMYQEDNLTQIDSLARIYADELIHSDDSLTDMFTRWHGFVGKEVMSETNNYELKRSLEVDDEGLTDRLVELAGNKEVPEDLVAKYISEYFNGVHLRHTAVRFTMSTIPIEKCERRFIDQVVSEWRSRVLAGAILTFLPDHE